MMNSTEVLLVEDNPTDAELTIKALLAAHLSNDIKHVMDGAEALDYIFCKGEYENREGNHPNLILLDLNMPRISGMDVIRELKANEQTKTIPIIVLTSSNLDPDIATAYKLGVNSYIVKPVEFDQFAKSVAELGHYWMLLNKSPSRR